MSLSQFDIYNEENSSSKSTVPLDIKEETKEQITSPNVSNFSFQEWNEVIGLPFSYVLQKPNPMTQYQLDYVAAINKHHRVIINKTRKGGFTDAILRHIAKEAFGRYAGFNCVIMASNKADIALQLLQRLNELFLKNDGFTDCDGVKWTYDQLIKKFNLSNMVIEFHNGTVIHGSPISNNDRTDPLRGMADVKVIFLTEASHSGKTNDDYVMSGVEPLISNFPDGDIIIESTPNGKRGFFYDMWQDATNEGKNIFTVGENRYYSLQYDYKEALEANILSPQLVEDIKANPKSNFEQEFCCKFTTSLTSAFMEDEIRGLDKGESSIDLTSMLETA